MEHQQLVRDMERVVHKYLKGEEIKRDYGTGQLLTRREIHTVQLVGETPGVNPGVLAKRHGVTRGAASQMVSRLCEKGLVERRSSPNSLSEVALFLTERGETAFCGHAAYHAAAGAVWESALHGMGASELAAVETFLSAVEKILDAETQREETT